MTKRDVNGNSKKNKLVLAYSGGLDTSVILAWLVEKGFEVICFCANVGQGDEDFEAIKAKALKCGASKAYVEDLRKEFVVEFVRPAVKCNAIYEGQVNSILLSRPLSTLVCHYEPSSCSIPGQITTYHPLNSNHMMFFLFVGLYGPS